jgi:hypothetical protein
MTYHGRDSSPPNVSLGIRKLANVQLVDCTATGYLDVSGATLSGLVFPPTWTPKSGSHRVTLELLDSDSDGLMFGGKQVVPNRTTLESLHSYSGTLTFKTNSSEE